MNLSQEIGVRINKMTDTIVCDVDNTISYTVNGDYENATPNTALIEKLKYYKKNGYEIVLYTSRNMRTYKGDIETITIKTLPTLKAWLSRHGVPYDKIVVGKPWCGENGFYVDDKAVRPREFIDFSSEELMAKIKQCS
jgi:capsule biosynthesis phosphatase